ncbi:MAG: hypothetical protein HY704_03665 [Gemmatimonadetes bacterium]|nr:hypothetical protein [Gemmatimonadota bacterium]
MRGLIAVWALSFPVLPVGAALAQERAVTEAALPRAVAEEIVEFFNRPTTIHFRGASRIPPERVIVGDVAVLGGPFTVLGRIEGEVVVVNGDLEFESGGSVQGDVTVVGGAVQGAGAAEVSGTLTVYEEALRYVHRGDRIRYVGTRRRDRGRLSHELGFGRSRFTIRSFSSYNRVEGLPVMFGPIIETSGSHPMRVEAFGIWRTESGFSFDTELMGYSARIEQFAGGHRAVRVGVGARSVVEPIETWGLTALESSLATFVYHKDYRDYFERQGWQAYVRVTPQGLPLDATVEYRTEEHRVRAPGGPWALVDNDEPWRPQPLVGEGTLRSVVANLELDVRSDRDDPADGWYLNARVERGLGGSLAIPAATVPGGGTGPAAPVELDERFTHALLDLRRYNRVAPGARLDLRAVVGGALEDRALPPQFQHALGGEGSLPGYRLFEGDCGARNTVVAYGPPGGVQEPFFPAYGCDRFAVLQVEYRGRLSFDIGFGGDDDDWDEIWDSWSVDVSPSWVVFFNAGKGWALDGPGGPGGTDTSALYDAGVGLLLGNLGVYWAVPLNGDERSPNFFVRLGQRF